MKTKGGGIFTCNALNDKEARNLAVLELVRKKGVISRTDISRATGINVVSVSNYIGNFIEEGLVIEKGLAASSGGRKPELVELNVKDNRVLGVDICDTSLCVILADIGMNVITKKKTARPGKKKEVAGAVMSLIENVAGPAGLAKAGVKSIGISVSSESLLPVREAVEKKFGINTFIGDATSCAAFAEKRFNKEADVKRLLYLHSDLGRGVIIDGEICIGCVDDSREPRPPAQAGEGGSESPDARKAKYLNPWNSCLGMVETAKREVARGVGTRIVSLAGSDIGNITESTVMDAAGQNDETALSIIQSVMISLGLRTAYLINLFAPDIVVIGGGPEKAPAMTVSLIDKMVKKLSAKEHIDKIKVIPSKSGEEGLCLGASALAVREIFLKA